MLSPMATKELWRPVVGYEGLYEVSNLGRIKALARFVNGRWGQPHPVKERVMRPYTDRYPMLLLYRENERKNVHVHRLVLEAWVGPRPKGLVGCHNDGDRTNNAISNLRWDTLQANSDDIDRHGRRYCGTAHHMSKLKPANVRAIRRKLANGVRPTAIAKAYGVSTPSICSIRDGKSWKSVT